MKPEIIFQTPDWYIVLCLICGLLYSLFLYFKSYYFKKNHTLLLSTVRGVLVFLVAFLLLNPLLKTIKNVILKPKVVLVIDNSRSMLSAGKQNLNELFSNVSALTKSLDEKGFEVSYKNLNSEELSADSLNQNLSFSLKKSNYSDVFSKLKNEFEGQNLSDVILVGDGILNEGVSPNYQKYNFNIHTIGIGDTTLKKDAFISGLTANKLAYLGNNYTLNIDLGSYLLAGRTSQIIIKDANNKILGSKVINISKNDDFQSHSFELKADKVGKQRILVDLMPIQGEVSTKNNHKEIIIDVVNGKEKILLVAYSPHPDIKALKSIIESNDLFELNIQILQSTDIGKVGVEPFDILILHQLPDAFGNSTGLVSGLLSKGKPTFFIVGSKTNISVFNGMQMVLGINSQLYKLDKALPSLNLSFSLFNIDPLSESILSKLPPISVPFGEYKSYPGIEVILNQKIAGINTTRPLLALDLNNARKSGVLVGEGLWQWRQEEYAINDNSSVIDNLVIKCLQLISVKSDKTKLRVYPVSDLFNIDQRIGFEGEVYNELFEKIYGNNITLKIKADNGSEKAYNFTITKENSRFDLSNLQPGVYSYSASSIINNKPETVSGQFIVASSDIELSNTVADFNFLRTISSENNGNFVQASNAFELRNSFNKSSLVDKIISNEELKDFINLKWLLILIIILASIEWVARKYLGHY